MKSGTHIILLFSLFNMTSSCSPDCSVVGAWMFEESRCLIQLLPGSWWSMVVDKIDIIRPTALRLTRELHCKLLQHKCWPFCFLEMSICLKGGLKEDESLAGIGLKPLHWKSVLRHEARYYMFHFVGYDGDVPILQALLGFYIGALHLAGCVSATWWVLCTI